MRKTAVDVLWILIIAWLAFPVVCGAEADSSMLSAEEVVGRLTEANRLPAGVRFRQDVKASLLLLTWEFYSDIEYDGEHLVATTVGAPDFVPDSLPTDLLDLVRPDLFALDLIKDGEDFVYVLSGERIEYGGVGAKHATYWIDSRWWTVTKAEAIYPWGKLTVHQEYSPHEGRRLLERQEARATPYGLRLEVTYSNYQFSADEEGNAP